MIADLKPYAEYKESGLPWLGQVPGHWGTRRMKFLFKERAQKGFPDEPLLAATQRKGVVRKEDYGLRTVTAMNGLENLKLVEIGDFVISLRSFQGGIEVSHARGIISPAYTVLRPRDDFEPRYFKAYFKSDDFVRSLTLFVTGIREGQNIDYERLSRAFMPLPPPAEQAAIVRFLDWANGRLERAIRAKRKVVALLGEQKQAIIHRAVTRGLDPVVPLKPSGIPWLGDIPEHWEVTVAKRVCSVFIPQRDKPELNEVEGIPWVTLESVGKTFVKPSRFFVRERDARAVGSRTVPSGSVLASCVGRFGITSITTGPVIINQQIQAFVPRAHLSNLFLRYSVLIAKPYFEMQGNSTTLAYVDREGFETMPLLIPPRSEQDAIVDHLKEATEGIDSAISRLEREIDLLREYRTRLVADVVTGKLDVRAAAASLPAEAPLDTIEDDADLSDETDAADEEAGTA